MSSRVSTPVIFVTIGCEDFLPILSNTLDSYVEGPRHILITDDVDEIKLKAKVARVWREFLDEGSGHADVVRVNYILRADENGLKLPAIKKVMETYLQALYPAGILADIYCLLNDANLLDDSNVSRREVLEVLKDEEAECVYMMSNLTSLNMFIPDADTAQTIALLTLFKDCEPDFYVGGADASRYNEFFFLENCAMRQGCFLTAASLILTIPQDALKALLITELLYYGKHTPIDPEPSWSVITESPTTTPVKSLEYLCGLAIPDHNRNDKLTRKQWITRLFGQRLKKLNGEPEEVVQTSGEIPIAGHNLFDLLRYTGKSNIFEENIENDLHKAEEKYNLWMEEIPSNTKDSRESAKRRLSPLLTQDLWAYELANAYLRKNSELEHIRAKTQAKANRRDTALELKYKLTGYLTMLEAVAQPYEEKIQELNESFATFTNSAENYFRKCFNDYAHDHSHELAELSKEMTGYLQENKIMTYIARLEKYVDEHLMPTFINRPIMEILDYFAQNGNDKAAALGEWSLKNRHYSTRLKIGYTSLHTEANLFIPSTSSDEMADLKRHYEGRGVGRMNLFAKTDAVRIAILYHAGSFDLEDLYYNL